MYPRNNFLYLSLLFSFAMMFSCANTSDYKSDVILGETNNTIKFCEHVNSASITILNDDSSCIIGQIKKVEETADSYFAMNQQKTAIVKFDKKGNFVDKLHKVGRAKDEYVTINDFSVDEKSQQLALLCNYTKIIICDLSFNIKEIFDWGMPMERICLHNSYLYGLNQIENKIVFLSGKKPQVIIHGIRPDSWVFTQTSVFFKTGNKLLATLECDNNVYVIDSCNVYKYLSFTYEGYKEVINQYRKKNNDQTESTNQIPLARIWNINESNDTLNLFYSKDWVIRYASIDMNNKTIIFDGIFIGSPSPKWNGLKHELIAESFSSGSGFPIDTSYIKKIDSQFDPSMIGSVIVKYKY